MTRRAISFRALTWASLLLSLSLGLIAWLAYRAYVDYEPQAGAHLPEQAELRVELNCEHVIALDPLRKHLLPLLALWGAARPAPSVGDAPAAQPRLEALRERAQLNFSIDLREVAWARSGESWLLALGGLFPERGMIEHIESVLASEGMSGLSRSGERLQLESGAVLAQAADGVLLAASDARTLDAALPARGRASRTSRALPLHIEARANTLSGWLDPPPTWLSSIERITVTSRLERGIALTVALQPHPDADVSALRSDLEGWLASPENLTGWSGTRAALAHAKLTPPSGADVILNTQWNIAELDRAARELSAWLAPRLQARGAVEASSLGAFP